MDQHIFFLINRTWSHPSLDLLMATASSWDFWWPVLVVGAVWALAAGGFRARAMVAAAVVAVGVTDAIVVDSIKGVVGRPRPNAVLEGARSIDLAKARPRFLALGKPLKVEWTPAGRHPKRGNSFPSGHAANNFAVATVVFLFYRRRGWLAFVPAALVSYSRIYVGSHWPSDVLVSCALGSLLAVLVVHGLGWGWRKFGGRWFPGIHRNHPELLET